MGGCEDYCLTCQPDRRGCRSQRFRRSWLVDPSIASPLGKCSSSWAPPLGCLIPRRIWVGGRVFFLLRKLRLLCVQPGASPESPVCLLLGSRPRQMVGAGMGAVRTCISHRCPWPRVVDGKPVFALLPKDLVCREGRLRISLELFGWKI